MRMRSEIEAQLRKLKIELQLRLPTATVFENAPLALIQLELETKIATLKWVLMVPREIAPKRRKA
mgnify:CR=1 FL=1